MHWRNLYGRRCEGCVRWRMVGRGSSCGDNVYRSMVAPGLVVSGALGTRAVFVVLIVSWNFFHRILLCFRMMTIARIASIA